MVRPTATGFSNGAEAEWRQQQLNSLANSQSVNDSQRAALNSWAYAASKGRPPTLPSGLTLVASARAIEGISLSPALNWSTGSSELAQLLRLNPSFDGYVIRHEQTGRLFVVLPGTNDFADFVRAIDFAVLDFPTPWETNNQVFDAFAGALSDRFGNSVFDIVADSQGANAAMINARRLLQRGQTVNSVMVTGPFLFANNVQSYLTRMGLAGYSANASSVTRMYVSFGDPLLTHEMMDFGTGETLADLFGTWSPNMGDYLSALSTLGLFGTTVEVPTITVSSVDLFFQPVERVGGGLINHGAYQYGFRMPLALQNGIIPLTDRNGDGLITAGDMVLDVGRTISPQSGAVIELIPGRCVLVIAEDGTSQIVWFNEQADTRQISVAQFAQLFGSTLGRQLIGGDILTSTLSGAILGAVGLNVGQAIDAARGLPVTVTLDNGSLSDVALGAEEVWSDFDNELAAFTANAAIGSISSFLTLELGEALGLEGFGAEMFSTGVGELLSHTLNNLVADAEILSGVKVQGDWFDADGLTDVGANALASAFVSFFATKLGSLVVQPQTQAASILSSLGAAAGAMGGMTGGHLASAAGYVAQQALGAIGLRGVGVYLNYFLNAIPGVGVFLGFILGAFIGNLFGRKKPRIPTANAEVFLQVPSAQYALGAVTQSNGGNIDLVRAMGMTARDTLNGLIAIITHDDTSARVSNTYSPSQYYGHTGGQLWVKYDANKNGTIETSEKFNVSSADEAVDKGVLFALPATQIVGGDMALKRALYNMVRNPGQVTSVAQLAGDLQVAEDYAFYLRNRNAIDALIAEPYTSMSTAQKAFYDTNRAFITRALAMEQIPLEGADISFYASNQAMVDSIIDGLQLTQFAAGWIVTLQRAAELELDRSAVSDFYGGAKGFIDGLAVTFEIGAIDYERVQFALQGSDNDLLVTYRVRGESEDRTFLERKFLTDAGYSTDTTTAIAEWYSDPVIGTFAWYTHLGVYNNNIKLAAATSAALTLDDTQQVYGVWSSGVFYPYPQPFGTQLGPAPGKGDDIFVASNGADTVEGGVGHDWLDGGAGNDIVRGGDGDDMLLGKAGIDSLYGGAGNDYLAGGDGNDIAEQGGGLWGEAGDDVIDAGMGSDGVWGGDGNDTIIVTQETGVWDWYAGDAGADTASFERFTIGVNFDLSYRPGWTWAPDARNGGAGFAAYDDGFSSVENLIGSSFNDVLQGDEIANTIGGGRGADAISALAGNDVVEGGEGADTLNGGDGIDTLSYKNSKFAVWLNLATAEAFGGDAEGDVVSNFENIEGSRHADVFTGNAVANRLSGLAGDDWFVASAGADVYEGGEGFDTVEYGDAVAGMTINLVATNQNNGLAAGHTYTSIEHVVGSNFVDRITMTTADETITGGKGNDILAGGAGSDTYVFYRGDGVDTITDTNNGSNVIVFGEGVTWSDIWIGAPTGQFQIGIRSATDQMSIANNFVSGNNVIKSVDMGGAGVLDVSMINKVTVGTDTAQTLYGGSNTKDWILGYGGNDTIHGQVNGGAEQNGNVIIGGAGNDAILTSSGDDQFAFDRGDGVDTITDAGGEDTIVFGPGTAADDVIFEVVGNDLYVAARDLANPQQTASQVADRMRIVNGGIKYVGMVYGGVFWNTVEYVRVGGAEINLTKLDLNWTAQPYMDFSFPPIAFDLGADGLDLVSVSHSQIVGEDENGGLVQLGWLDGQDGFLAIDRNGDGAITNLSEISFVSELAGASTDLEGLAGLDSNWDGVINSLDARWSELKLWRDVNQNGRGHGNEVVSLAEAGIVEIQLSLSPTGFGADDSEDSIAANTATFIWSDGRTGTVHDVLLAGRPLSGQTSSIAADLELGRLDGLATAPVLERADARDGVDPLAPVVAKKSSIQDIEEAVLALNGAPVEASAGVGVAPIVIDLAGDGFDLVSASASQVYADINADGWIDRVGWIGAGDALLGLDRDGDGLIRSMEEISFVGDIAGAQSDLEGLAAFDSNANGLLDADDARFAHFMLWRDANQDGASSTDELTTLSQAGIAGIDLTLVVMSERGDPLSNAILRTTHVTFADGGVRQAGDVVLGSQSGLKLAIEAAQTSNEVRGSAGSYAALDADPLFAPWALNSEIRRLLMGEQDEVATSPAVDDAIDATAPSITPLELMTREPRRVDGGVPVNSQGSDRPRTRLAGNSDDAPDSVAPARRRADVRWWGEGLEAPRGQPPRSLISLMQRLTPVTLVDRDGESALRADRTMPSAETNASVDAFKQAVAALGRDVGGESKGDASNTARSTDVALPTSWRRRHARLSENA